MQIVDRKCGMKEVECPALMSFSTPGCPEVFHHSQLSFMLSLAFSVNMTQVAVTQRAGVSVKVKT